MSIIRRPRSLFGRTAAILALTLLVFTLSVVAVSGWFVVFPVGKRSADDFAALMVLAARTRVELPPEAEADFRQELLQQHGLILGDGHQPLPVDPSLHPYLRFFEAALQRRTGEPVKVMHSDDGMMWVDVPVPNGKVRLGFRQERVGARPILMIAFILLTGVVVTLVAAVLLARLVVRPLATVAYAVGEVGGGRTPPPLPETGPREIAVLARTINRMSVQVRELLANRTVLLSGISHDLRTPLTRLRLALEMLEDNPDPDLLAGMTRDLEAMDTLIGQFLELAHGLDQDQEAAVAIDMAVLLESLVADARRGGAQVRLEVAACQVFGDQLSLKRILGNLLENAIRYGDGQPIDVRLECRPDATVIEVCDRGQGIPEAEREAVFRPFHRLEAARSRETGGSGLGLAIARQLADGQGWRLELLAREGGGTVAQVSLFASG